MHPIPTAADRSFDIVSLGECLVELCRRDDGAFTASVAGDALNTLVHASRLGLRTGLVTLFGDDLFTPMITERIAGAGIDTSLCFTRQGYRNGLYVIETDEQGEYTFHYWRAGSAASTTLASIDIRRITDYAATSRVLLTSGITAAVMRKSSSPLAVMRPIRDTTLIAFDTNYRSRLWGSPKEYLEMLDSMLPHCDILLPSVSDLRGIYGNADLTGLCREFRQRGVRRIFVKDGARGSACFIDGELVWTPPEEVIQPVDTTGAGDAFNAGCIAALLDGATDLEACIAGNHAAAKVLTHRGAIDWDT